MASIADRTVLVTGNRGIGRALVEEALNEEEDIFPDPMSTAMADSWRSSAVKALERQLAAFVEAEPVTS